MSSFWNFLTKEPDKKYEDEEERARNKNNLNVLLNGFVYGASNDRFTAEQVLSIPVANACLAIIVNSIKDLPVELYERIDEKTTEKKSDDYRIKLLNDAPNIISTGIDFKARMIKDIVLHGNAYVEIERNGNTIESLWNLDSEDVSIRTLKDANKPYIIKDIIIEIAESNVSLGIDDVMIMTTDSEDGGLSGNGVIAYGDEIIELALNEIELSKNIMSNGSSPASVLTVQKQLSPEAQQRLRDSWNKMYQGANNSGKLIILEEGMEYDKISYTPSELNMVSSMDTTSTFICQLFGVPEQMVMASKNTYGSVESMSIRFLQYCISPIISVLESSFNRSLLLEKEKGKYFFKIDTTNILQTTMKERYEALNTAISAGIMSLNEARIKENLTPLPTDFNKFSLGNIFYSAKDNTMFVANTGVTFDAENKQIISSPDIQMGINSGEIQQNNDKEKNDNQQKDNKEQNDGDKKEEKEVDNNE